MHQQVHMPLHACIRAQCVVSDVQLTVCPSGYAQFLGPREKGKTVTYGSVPSSIGIILAITSSFFGIIFLLNKPRRHGMSQHMPPGVGFNIFYNADVTPKQHAYYFQLVASRMHDACLQCTGIYTHLFEVST